MSRRSKVEDESLQGTWLNTYGDMVTLLLCFFVLLFSMSTLDSSRFKQIVLSLSGNEGGGKGVIGSQTSVVPLDQIEQGVELKEQSDIELYQAAKSEEEKLKVITNEISDYVLESGLTGNVEVYNQEQGVLIRFSNNVLFDKGSAQLKPDAIKTLTEMARILKKYNRVIKVEGHTDNDPISNHLYPSNWELSTARAVNVVKFFVSGLPEEERLNPELLQAAGYGEYRPLFPNTSEENKARNRRIEIVIVKNTD